MRKGIVAAVAVLVLAGCGDNPAPAASPPAVASSSPSPSASPIVVEVARDVPATFAGWFAQDPAALDLGTRKLYGGSVAGPGYHATINTVATRTSFVAERLDTLHLTPAAGTFPPGPPPATRELTTLRAGAGRQFLIAKTEGTLAKAAIRVGGTSYPLGETPEDALLVVAVPPKAGVLLEVGDTGHRQALDMRTGKRHDREPGRYETIVEQWETTGRPAERIANYAWVRAGGAQYVAFVDSYIVKRLPWIEGRGYAPKGKAWLTAQVYVGATPTRGGGHEDDTAKVTLDPGRGLRIDGMGPIKGSYRHEDDSYQFVVAVPKSFTRGSLRMSVAGAKLEINGKKKSFRLLQTLGSSTTMKLD